MHRRVSFGEAHQGAERDTTHLRLQAQLQITYCWLHSGYAGLKTQTPATF